MQIFSPGLEEIEIQLSNLRMLLITERNRASGLEQSLGHSTAFFVCFFFLIFLFYFLFSVQRKMVFVKCRL